jgi:hypothetical protein
MAAANSTDVKTLIACSKCDAANSDDSKFCKMCGAKVEYIKPRSLAEILQTPISQQMLAPIWCGKYIKSAKMDILWGKETEGATLNTGYYECLKPMNQNLVGGNLVSLDDVGAKWPLVQYSCPNGEFPLLTKAWVDPGNANVLSLNCGKILRNVILWKKLLNKSYADLSAAERPIYSAVTSITHNKQNDSVDSMLSICNIPHFVPSSHWVPAMTPLGDLATVLIENNVQEPRVGMLVMQADGLRAWKLKEAKSVDPNTKIPVTFRQMTADDYTPAWSYRAAEFAPANTASYKPKPEDPTMYEWARNHALSHMKEEEKQQKMLDALLAQLPSLVYFVPGTQELLTERELLENLKPLLSTFMINLATHTKSQMLAKTVVRVLTPELKLLREKTLGMTAASNLLKVIPLAEGVSADVALKALM